MLDRIGSVSAPSTPTILGHEPQNEIKGKSVGEIQGEPVDGLKFSRTRERSCFITKFKVGPLQKNRVIDTENRRMSLFELEGGRYEMRLARPPITELVLSGGGGKGRVYPAMHEALEASGALSKITHVLGASAGAIFAALIASGMEGEAVRELTDSVDLLTLLDSKSTFKKTLQQRLEALAPERVVRFLRLFVRLQSKAHGLREMLERTTKAAVLERIEAYPQALSNPAVLEVRDRLRLDGNQLTFKDLAVLSVVVPGVKQLSVTGTAMTETGPQLVLLDQHNTPDMSVASAVHASAAFPLLFKQVPLSYQGRVTQFQDGGLMCNTPVPDKYLKRANQMGLGASEPLILTFQQTRPGDPPIEARVRSPLDWLSGTPNTAQGAYWAERLQPLKLYTVAMPTKTPFGDFSGLADGTMNFDKLVKQTEFMCKRLFNNIQSHLKEHAQVRVSLQFGSLEEALLALDDDLFSDVHKANPGLAEEVKVFRDQAFGVLTKLSSAPLDERKRVIADELDHLVGASSSRRDWVAERLLQAGIVKDWTGKPPEIVERALQMNRAAQMADNAREIARSMLAPAIFEAKQSTSNKALLGSGFAQLMKMPTSESIKQVLENVIGHYQCTDPGRSQLLLGLIEWRKNLAL